VQGIRSAKDNAASRSEYKSILKRTGITPAQARRAAKLSEIPESEIDRLIHEIPTKDVAARTLKMRNAR
jgi:hypothetical protein